MPGTNWLRALLTISPSCLRALLSTLAVQYIRLYQNTLTPGFDRFTRSSNPHHILQSSLNSLLLTEPRKALPCFSADHIPHLVLKILQMSESAISIKHSRIQIRLNARFARHPYVVGARRRPDAGTLSLLKKVHKIPITIGSHDNNVCLRCYGITAGGFTSIITESASMPADSFIANSSAAEISAAIAKRYQIPRSITSTRLP